MAHVDRSFIVSSPDDKLLRAFVTTGVRVVSALVNGDWIVPLESLFQLPTAQGWLQENWTGVSSPDDKLLRAFVTTGVRVVSALVNGDWIVPLESLFQLPTAQGWLQENWTGFKEAANRVINSLRNIREDVWEKLRNAGLTWGHLKMKWQLWYDDLLSGRFSNILRRLNSILKSLATAIPLGECLAEYKEHVELTLKDLANLNFGDATGLIDLSAAE